jgi:hypothetical protein
MALVKHNNNSISELTTPGQIVQGKMILISEQTASGSASISFTSGIDSTYPIYKFEFINCHPSNDSVNFKMNLSTDGGSNYNVTKTTTFFYASHDEADTEAQIAYDTGRDLAQGTADAHISNEVGNGNDESLSGTMYLFNPSSSTYVKHFMSEAQTYHGGDLSIVNYLAGYGNTTSPVNAIKFLFQTGNIDSGKIKLYGIGD